jgi:Protein DA1
VLPCWHVLSCDWLLQVTALLVLYGLPWLLTGCILAHEVGSQGRSYCSLQPVKLLLNTTLLVCQCPAVSSSTGHACVAAAERLPAAEHGCGGGPGSTDGAAVA